MHVLQWLFKVAQDQKLNKDIDHHHNEDEKTSTKEEKKSKGIACQKSKKVVRKARKPEETGLDCRNFRYLALLLRSRGKSRAYLYSTLNQKTLTSLNHRQQQHYVRSMKMKEDHLLGNNSKVLPIGDSTTTSSSIRSGKNDQKQYGPSDQKKGRARGDQNHNKTKNLSRMKDLLRWSERGGKFGKKGLHLRSRSTAIKSGGFDDELTSNDSSNINVRWGIESHSTTCSDYDQCPSKTGHWITTDDEFVVLEL